MCNLPTKQPNKCNHHRSWAALLFGLFVVVGLAACGGGGGSDAPVNPPANTNSPPVAIAGANQSVFTGVQVVLDGSGSSDPDGNSLTYAWSLTGKPAGSAAIIGNGSSAIASLTPDIPGSYTAQLVVNDGKVNSAADSMVVTAVTANRPPVANAGPD